METTTTGSHQEWLEERKKGIGGSDIAAIMNLNPYSSPLAVWLDKTDPTYTTKSNIAMEIGKELEPYLRRKAEKEIAKVEGFAPEIKEWPGVLTGTKPYYKANIDGFFLYKEDQFIGIELKTTTSRARENWDGEIPINYILQIQWYMAVTGWPYFYLLILTDNRKVELHRIERNHQIIKEAQQAADDFWKMVEQETAPAPTSRDDKALEFLYPKTVPEKEITVSEDEEIEIIKAIEEMKAAQAIIKEQTEVVKAIKNQLKAALQDAEILRAGEHKVTYATIKKESYTVAATQYRTLKVTKNKEKRA